MALLAVSVVGSVLAIGTVHVAALLAVAPVAMTCGVVALRYASWRRLPVPLIVLLALVAYTTLQTVPIPFGLLLRIAPRNAEVWARCLEPLGEKPPNWAPLSLDPGASLREAVKWICYAGVFAGAAFVAQARRTSTVLALVFGSGLLVALLTLAHRVTGATALYGMYTPKFATPSFAIAPLLNENNLAGYLNLAAFAGLALLVTLGRGGLRWVAAVAVSIVVGTSALAASRGGWLSLAVGVPLLIYVLSRSKGQRSASRAAVVWIQLVAVAGGLALFVLTANARTWHALLNEGMQKLDLLTWTRPMIADYFWWGAGRGAFETTFPAYRGDVGQHLYPHAENFIAQWCSEWGVPVALLALAAFAWSLRPSALGLRRRAGAATAAVGAVVLLLHNLVDLALEVPAVSLAFFTVLGALWGGNPSRDKNQVRETAELQAGLNSHLLVAGAGIALFAAVTIMGRHPALEERDHMYHLLGAMRPSEPETHTLLITELRSAIRRHPGDPYLPLVGALAAYRTGGNTIPWIARAIERDPMQGSPHLLLAYTLSARGASSQALLAIRMAVERDFTLTAAGAKLALKLTREFNQLLRATPNGSGGVAMLEQLAMGATAPERRPLRARLLEEAIQRDASETLARQMRADDLVFEVESNSGECVGVGRADCAERIRALALDLAKINPKSERSVVLNARLLLADGQAATARSLLDATCSSLGTPDCWLWRVIVLERLNAPEQQLAEAMDAYLTAACTSALPCATAASGLGDRLMNQGRWAAAVRMYDRAARESRDPAAWQRLAAAAQRAGLDSVAYRALTRAKGGRPAADVPALGGLEDLERTKSPSPRTSGR